MLARASLVSLVLVAACPAPSRGPQGPGGGEPFELEREARQLVIPPAEGTTGALARIDAAAAGGDVRAGWVYLHYMVDVFDQARFGEDAAARAVLAKALGVADARGAAATDAVLDALLVKADRVLERERLHGGAQAARTLLAGDRNPPAARKELFARMTEWKGIARGGGPLAANAALRLAGFCRTAFRDAVAVPLRDRAGVLAFCLYPLFDSDPEPYFAADPALRPPPPAWQDLADGVKALLAEAGAAGGRLAPLVAQLGKADEALFAERKAFLPGWRDASELRLPLVAAAAPYDGTPLVMFASAAALPANLAAELRPAVEEDGRGRVAVGFPAGVAASAILDVARAARAAGAGELEVLVGYEQQLKVPPGDYWHGRAQGGKVVRLGTIAFSLALLPGEGEASRDTPRATSWDPALAALGLHLVAGTTSWQLVAPEGEFPALGSVDDAAKAQAGLRAQLEQIRLAYPDEDGLIVIIEKNATVGALALAAQAARWTAGGGDLFGRLAFGAAAPAAKGNLPARVTRRAAVKVAITPAELGGKTAAVRRCYLSALDTEPKLEGTLVLELDEKAGGVKVASGPKHAGLRKCAGERVGQAMVAGSFRNAQIKLSLK